LNHHLGASLKGRLLALPANVRLGCKSLSNFLSVKDFDLITTGKVTYTTIYYLVTIVIYARTMVRILTLKSGAVFTTFHFLLNLQFGSIS
jgi:hypothetical protein